MTFSLTPKQAKLLRFICEHMDAHAGVAPSFVEMKDALGVSSKSAVHRILEGLEARGHIQRLAHRPRAIAVLVRAAPGSEPRPTLREQRYLEARAALVAGGISHPTPGAIQNAAKALTDFRARGSQ